jgi:hypothetical protein
MSDRQAASSSVDVEVLYGKYIHGGHKPGECSDDVIRLIAALERAQQEIAEGDREIERLRTCLPPVTAEAVIDHLGSQIERLSFETVRLRAQVAAQGEVVEADKARLAVIARHEAHAAICNDCPCETCEEYTDQETAAEARASVALERLDAAGRSGD